MVLDIAGKRKNSSTYAIFAMVTLLVIAFAVPVVEAQSFTAAYFSPNVPDQHPPNPRPSWAQAPVRSGTYSLNWAGYVVASSFTTPAATVTMANGSWVVQTVAASRKPTYSAQWVGIGGFFDSTLIQTGTSSDSASGATNYYAWYELLPASETQLGSGYPVSAGDRINALVFLVGVNSWNITINDLTRPWHFSLIVSYVSSQTSAEWIEERPAISGSLTTLANFGTARYGQDNVPAAANTDYATVGTSTSPIGSLTWQSIIMVSNNGRALATPSALSTDGTSFTMAYSGR